MLNLRSARSLLSPIAMVSVFFGVAGCGLGPGDHVFYRVASEAAVSDKSCFQNGTIPDSIKDDSSTVLGGSTVVLYITGDKLAELDTGSLVLEGDKADKGYRFNGQTVDVSYPANGLKTTSKVDVTINMTISGSTISGTTTTITSDACEGVGCPMDANHSCTTTAQFKGVEIDDAEVVVGDSNPAKP